jgi:hypothetical protein
MLHRLGDTASKLIEAVDRAEQAESDPATKQALRGLALQLKSKPQ